MITDSIKVAVRKLKTETGSSFVKLFSLIVGIICVFFISIYVHEEVNYDAFHSKKSSIYKVNTDIIASTGNLKLGLTATPVGNYLIQNATQVEQFVRIFKEFGARSVRYGDKLFSESENIFFADPNFFNVFDIRLESGNQEQALTMPNTMVISQSIREKYFGSEKALDNTIIYDGRPIIITGVFEDLPDNTQFKFDFLISMATFMQGRPNVDQNWYWIPMNTYLLLSDPEKIESIEAALKSIPQYADPEASPQYVLTIEPFEGIHFSEPRLGELGSKGSMADLYVLASIGLMILLLAVSNYINLNIAQITTQGKQVSVRKTLGASRREIFIQFFTESFIYSIISWVVSAVLIFLLLNDFKQFMGHDFDLGFLSHPLLVLVIVLFPLILSFLGGFYPALKFSRVAPISIMKEKVSTGWKTFDSRTLLLVFQFGITSILIISSLIIYKQMNYVQTRDLGVNTDQTLVIDYGPDGNIANNYESLKSELGAVNGVSSVSFSSHIPGEMPNGVVTRINDENGQTVEGEINLTLVDYDFIKDYELELIAGEAFRPDRIVDTVSYDLILNESAVKAFGYAKPEEVLGATYTQWGGNGRVIGVVKDFNYLSLHQEVGLASFKMWPDQFRKISLKVSADNLQHTISELREKWIGLYPDVPFNYYFVDDQFNAQYKNDIRFANIIGIFTLVSLSIGVLGMIAFATFWCERKRKEISIRKVLGANSLVLVRNFYFRFSRPVLVSFLLGIPVAWYFSNLWLQQFAYQAPIRSLEFLVPLVVLLAFVAFSVGYQTMRVVLSNPVNTLKEE